MVAGREAGREGGRERGLEGGLDVSLRVLWGDAFAENPVSNESASESGATRSARYEAPPRDDIDGEANMACGERVSGRVRVGEWESE